jgi:TRAP-type C4-dicarboxylate transport system permease small subunit
MENETVQSRGVNGMSRGLAFLIGVDFLGLFVLNVGQIASRSILGMSSVSIPDISRFLFIWLVFLGTAAIYLRKGHLAITFLTERFSPALRRRVALTTQLAMAGFLLILIRGGWKIMVIRNIEQIIAESVHEVFETLIFILPDDGPPRERLEGKFKGEVIASIQITGDVSGILTMTSSRALAGTLTRNMLGLPDDSYSPEDVYDCTGEIVNIITGNIKTRCLDQGLTFSLSIPTVASGEQMVISLQEDVKGVELPFTIEGEELCISLLLRESPAA